ncbi:MAG TPA: hypothetical protein VK843_05155, partial [Planctomycetota bacterium]|nr:hypothetical protein [Planctomycetota bacterium]
MARYPDASFSRLDPEHIHRALKIMTPWSALAVCGLSASLLTACGGSSGSGGSGSNMDLVQMSNGFGVMVPYQVHKPDLLGNPTNQIVSIRSLADLQNNVSASNPVVAATELPLIPQLPNGDAGNQFIFMEFSAPIDIDTVLSKSPSGQSNSGLTTNIAVIAVDPSTNTSTLVRGRAFVGGKTYSSNLIGIPPALVLETWVLPDANGKPVANLAIPPISPHTLPPGLGFPGTQSTSVFNGSELLLKPSTFVFVADTDGDLSTHETFPTNRQIIVQASTAVRSISGRPLIHAALGSTTVGPDTIPPEVAQTPPPNSHPDT